MKQAILAVHFGTNYPNGRAAMNSMDEAMKAVASEADFFSVTSKGLESGLSVVKKEGYTHIVVQSTYLLDGVKYRELEADTAKWRPNFTQFLLSPPLLSSTADLKHLADGLDQLYRPKNDEILVLVGHGTSCFSNVVYPALQGIFHTMGRDDIVIGTVEGFPNLQDVLNYLSRCQYTRLHLVPLMMTAGKHAYDDIAGEKNSWKSRLKQAGYDVRCTMQGLSELPQAQEIVVEHLMKVMRTIK